MERIKKKCPLKIKTRKFRTIDFDSAEGARNAVKTLSDSGELKYHPDIIRQQVEGVYLILPFG